MSGQPTFQPGLLRNKAAFITGGGSGINRQIAVTYALAGAAVTVVGRSAEKACDAVAEIEASGGQPSGCPRMYATMKRSKMPSRMRTRHSDRLTSWSPAPPATLSRRPRA